MFTPYWALLLGVPLSFALRSAQHLGVLSTVALTGGYRQVAGGRWYWSHESVATQAEINIHLSMMSALSIYTVLMRTNSPKQSGCLQLTRKEDRFNCSWFFFVVDSRLPVKRESISAGCSIRCLDNMLLTMSTQLWSTCSHFDTSTWDRLPTSETIAPSFRYGIEHCHTQTLSLNLFTILFF